MKLARFARNVVLVALAFRLIVRRRNALARERRARRIAPLLITAGGAGVILAVRPRILEGARRFWNVARNQMDGDTSNVVSKPQPRALADTEPMPRVNKHPKRVARSARSKNDRNTRAYGVQAKGRDRSEPTSEPVDSPKH